MTAGFASGLSMAAILLVVGTGGCSRDALPLRVGDEATAVPRCTGRDLAGPLLDQGEGGERRLSGEPVVVYPTDTGHAEWGFSLEMRIDASGRVACHAAHAGFGQPVEMNLERKAFIARLGDWRYRPMLDAAGRPVDSRVLESIHEQREPGDARTPDVLDPADASIVLSRTGCFGMCPAYEVAVSGSGEVTYTGHAFVDVVGEHRYEVDPMLVGKLLDEIREWKLWAMDDVYRAPITDQPTYLLRFTMGGQMKSIADYAGTRAGMPEAVRRFQELVDEISGARGFVEISADAVSRLEEAGFAFASQEGADLLLRAVANYPGGDEEAMLRLLELGAPAVGGTLENRFHPEGVGQRSLLVTALANGRGQLADRLLDAAALSPDERNQAFHAAIRGGRLAQAKHIWNDGGAGERPALAFVDDTSQMETSVLLLLERNHGDEDWEGLEITKWLASLGVDLKSRAANGNTLLHNAARARDAALVGYLLEQGVDPSTKGEYGLPALGSAMDEDVALLLLQAEPDWSMDDGGEGFLRYARNRRWSRVLALIGE